MSKIKEEIKEIDIVKDLLKKYGEGTVINADFILDKPKKIHSLSPILDIALSGGVPEGCLLLCSGKAKSGKSTLSLKYATNCQQDNRRVFYLDVEGRIQGNQKLLKSIKGLDTSKLEIISSTREKILTAAEFLTIAEDIAKNVPRAVIIIDSASALCDASERTEELTANARVKGPKLLAAFTRRISNIIPVNDINLFIIQHMIANTSGWGSPFMEDGGNKIVYGADIKIRAKNFSDWKSPDGTLIGQSVKWQVEFSALGAPGAEVDGYIRYGHGIDEVWELITLGIDLNLIEKGVSWFTTIFLEKHGKEPIKMQGQEKVWNLFQENPEYITWLAKDIKEML